MKKMVKLFGLISIYTFAQAGVVVYAPIPQEAHELIEFLKNRVKEKIELKNKQVTDQEGKYIFDGGKYPPHLTLVYGADDLTMEQIQQQAPGIDNTLETIAHETEPINVTTALQNAQIDSFQGNPNYPKEIEGKKFKNFKILIIHMANHQPLIDFASNIRSTIETSHPNFKLSDLKFKAHLTVGWLFNEHDINPAEVTNTFATELKTDVEEYISKSKNPFIIKSFVLSTHDKLKKEFELKKTQSNQV